MPLSSARFTRKASSEGVDLLTALRYTHSSLATEASSAATVNQHWKTTTRAFLCTQDKAG